MDHGVVTDKTHRSAWTQWTYCGKGCYIPIHHQESWTLHLRDSDQTGDHDVTETEYNRYEIGDPYP